MNPRRLGPRLGGQVQQVIRAVKAGAWERSDDGIVAAGVQLEPGEYELKLAAADPDSTSALPGNAGLIALDLQVSRELAAEGTARDVVRIVQQARRDAGLAVSDRIRLTIGTANTPGTATPLAATLTTGTITDANDVDYFAVRAAAGQRLVIMGHIGNGVAVDLAVRPAAEIGGEPHPVGDSAVTVALARVPA